jgi:hypothetical protein
MNAILTTGESVKAHQCAFNSVIEIYALTRYMRTSQT